MPLIQYEMLRQRALRDLKGESAIRLTRSNGSKTGRRERYQIRISRLIVAWNHDLGFSRRVPLRHQDLGYSSLSG